MGAWIETLILCVGLNVRMSHPTWVRGLKHVVYYTLLDKFAVAPHVGAWIETFNNTLIHDDKVVAPHVGAWIETSEQVQKDLQTGVAPHVGAWIETLNTNCIIWDIMSHPTWVRGLKRMTTISTAKWKRSHPTWVRGLKQQRSELPTHLPYVAPHVGAWIETPHTTWPPPSLSSRTPRGCVD